MRKAVQHDRPTNHRYLLDNDQPGFRSGHCAAPDAIRAGGAVSKRQPFATRTIRAIGKSQIELAKGLLDNLPIDADKPIVITFGEEKKVRKPTANALMWVGPLKDIADQAWINGRQHQAEVWHGYFKAEYLPSEDDPEIESLAKDGYRKWDYGPKGDRVLVGSTTELTPRGFSIYLQQVEAFGASLGVMFGASKN